MTFHSEDPVETTDKRKLIFVWNYTNWGGAQIYLIAIMKAAARDWDVVVILPEGSSPDLIGFLKQAGVRYEFMDAELDLGPASSIRRRLVRHKSRIRAEVRTFRYLLKYDLPSSVLHLEFAPWQSWILYTALCFRGANVFLTMHNALPNRPHWRVAIWKARLQFLSRLRGFHLFTSNRDTRNKLKGWVEEGFWHKIKVTYTCVDPVQVEEALSKPFDKKDILDKHSIRSAKCVVLCVGQFIDRKGRWTFLEAARELARTNDDIVFVWVAPENPCPADQERIAGFGLGDRFRLILSRSVGSSRIDILSFFRIGDMFVLPTYLEGLPISLLEAMAIGLPVITTNVNAIPEAVRDDETGVLIPPGEPDSLAKAINSLGSDPSRRARLASAGQNFVLKNFDERVASRIAINEYEECLDPIDTK